MFKRLRNYFLTGLLMMLPAILTIVILRYLVIKLNLFLLDPITQFIPIFKSNPYIEYAAKFLAFILSVLFVVLIGLATRVIIIRNVFGMFEKILTKVPMVSKIYIAVKQLSNAFLGVDAKFFERVALIEYPRKGLYSIGLVAAKTHQAVAKNVGQELFNVFIPTSPNPTSGIFLLAPKEQLTFLEMSVEEALKLIVSVGKITSSY